MSSHPAMSKPASPSSLKARWLALRAEEPGLRPRDIAKRLSVTEAQLVASRCGDGVLRLQGPWSELVRELPSLGRVMVLTRNESVVHEKVGRFGNISMFQNMGMVLNEDIDLRIFFSHWYYGFSVIEETRGGIRRSLQFFDADGTAVHKIYLRVDSRERTFHRLVGKYRHLDQSATQSVLPRLRPPAELPDTFIDRAALRERWRALQDTHDFHAMLQELGVGRVQALRLVSEDAARLVGNDSFRVALQEVAAAGMSVMVFVGSPGVIQIHTGPVRTLRRVGPWYNVLDPGFSLHLREDRIASSWVVRKPTRDGVVTSLEIFDASSRQIAWLFGRRKPGEAEQEGWRELASALKHA